MEKIGISLLPMIILLRDGLSFMNKFFVIKFVCVILHDRYLKSTF